MTISATSNKTAPLPGDGANKNFDWTFEIPTEDDMVIVHTVTATGAETVITTNFSITNGIGESSGGTIVYPVTGSAIPSTETITIRRVLSLAQPNALPNQGGFFPATHEDMFDYLTMIVQQIDEELSRCVKLKVSSTQSDKEIQDLVASRIMVVSADGTEIEMSSSSIGDIQDDLGVLAALNTEIIALGALDTEIAALGAITTDITNLYTLNTEIIALGALTAEITALDAISADITTVAAADTDIGTIITNIADINTLGALGTEIQTVADNLSPTVTTVTSTTQAVTIDLSASRVFKHTFTEDTTFTFSNPDATGTRCSFELYLFNDGTGRTPTWPASVEWSNGVEPNVSQANEDNLIIFTTIDGGTRYFGALSMEALA